MGAKNLKAVALRGLGMLDAEEPDKFYRGALELFEKAPAERGFKSLCSALGAADVDAWLEPMLHRHRSCFACPGACSSFVKYNEEPSVMASEGVEEPGMLVTSLAAALWLEKGGWEAEPACRAMEAMAREGIDPVRGARELSAGPLSDPGAIADAVKGLQGSEDSGWPVGESMSYGLFGAWVPPLAPEDDWVTANRIGYVLGICPTYLLASGLDAGALFELCGPAAGLEIDADSIQGMF
jgi:aldehyde:ferredoxin oxidoreductase